MGDSKNTLFGQELRTLRRRSCESLAEVSGAVEIDVKDLGEIEAGVRLPSEDVVMLLISHFSLREDEALKLWRLAGFDNALSGISQNIAQTENISVADNRILYTDLIQVSANNYGVIINFLQGLGGDGKPSAVARVGMSREHAKSVVEVLQRTLNLADSPVKKTPKRLIDGN
jgi:hypothetical protein